MKKVKVDELLKYLNESYSGGVSIDDFNNGSSVYGVFIGSRGFVEEIYKVNDFKLRSKEEIIKDCMFDCDSDEDGRDYFEEFCDSGEVDWNDLGGVYESLNEEECIEYYNVVV